MYDTMLTFALLVASLTVASADWRTSKDLLEPQVLFEDDFNTLNLSVWQHQITMSGGGNWEFEYYDNNRSNRLAV
jgi:hypothetical protein